MYYQKYLKYKKKYLRLCSEMEGGKLPNIFRRKTDEETKVARNTKMLISYIKGLKPNQLDDNYYSTYMKCFTTLQEQINNQKNQEKEKKEKEEKKI